MNPEEVSLITQLRNLVFIAFQMQQYGFDAMRSTTLTVLKGSNIF